MNTAKPVHTKTVGAICSRSQLKFTDNDEGKEIAMVSLPNIDGNTEPTAMALNLSEETTMNESFLQQVTGALLERLQIINDRVSEIAQAQTELREMLLDGSNEKEWYSTTEVAEIMGVQTYTVAERWCNKSRIKCEKDPESSKWRIPGDEVRRLKNGGGLFPPSRC